MVIDHLNRERDFLDVLRALLRGDDDLIVGRGFGAAGAVSCACSGVAVATVMAMIEIAMIPMLDATRVSSSFEAMVPLRGIFLFF
jgi:hypothetical protein